MFKIIHFNFIDPPYSISLSPDRGSYQPGDTISCSAMAKPSAQYVWIDTNSTEVVSESSTLTIIESMLGYQTFLCRAYNQYGNDTVSIDFNVYSKYIHRWPYFIYIMWSPVNTQHIDCVSWNKVEMYSSGKWFHWLRLGKSIILLIFNKVRSMRCSCPLVWGICYIWSVLSVSRQCLPNHLISPLSYISVFWPMSGLNQNFHTLYRSIYYWNHFFVV